MAAKDITKEGRQASWDREPLEPPRLRCTLPPARSDGALRRRPQCVHTEADPEPRFAVGRIVGVQLQQNLPEAGGGFKPIGPRVVVAESLDFHRLHRLNVEPAQAR